MSLTPPSRSEDLICLWEQCYKSFDDPELLYNHLANDHVGRKSTGNLCLSCHWDKCEVQTTKRDHITSHLRVHVPLKPHICEVTILFSLSFPNESMKICERYVREIRHTCSLNDMT